MKADTIQPAEPGSSKKQSEPGDNLMKNYNRHPVEFAEGNGFYLYDTDGKEYLDFLSGIAVTGFGHKNSKITEAVEKQINKLWHVSNLFESGLQKTLASKLAEKSGLDSVFFCNSGTEANEAAIKFARKWGKGRTNIITAIGSFHGRTYGAMSATGQYKIWDSFAPLVPGFHYVPYGDLDVLEYVYSPHVAAIMVEPIQGESGIIVPPDGYLKGLRAFCDKHHILLIMDEVQTGMGRTGKLFAYQWEEIKPDIVAVAKGIANGLPLGAVLCTKEVGDEITPGSHGTTFGGNPVAVAGAIQVADMLDDNTLTHIDKMGKYLRDSINALGSPKIIDVRGKGLLTGVELSAGYSAKKVSSELLLNEGVVTGTSGESILRLLPPFIIGEKQIDMFVEKLNKVISQN